MVYLLAGSRVTKVRMSEKAKLGISEGRGGRRGPENVWGSAATGALCALATALPGTSKASKTLLQVCISVQHGVVVWCGAVKCECRCERS